MCNRCLTLNEVLGGMTKSMAIWRQKGKIKGNNSFKEGKKKKRNHVSCVFNAHTHKTGFFFKGFPPNYIHVSSTINVTIP